MSVVRFLAIPAMMFLSYEILKAIYKEKKFKSVPQIQLNKLRFNTDLSPQKQGLLREAKQYMAKHQGMQMVKSIRSEQFYQEELKNKIVEKQRQINTSLTQEERQSLKQEIYQLNKAFQSIHPQSIQESEYRQK